MARARGSSATRRLDAAGVDALLQQAGGAADPIVAVVGPDEALHRLAMRALLDAAADTDWVVHRVSARDPGAASVIRQACQPTLFGEESWLFATELEAGTDDALEALREVLPQASEEARLVLGHSGVARGRSVITAAQKAGAQLIEVRPVQASALPAVLSAHARRIGKVLPTEAAKAIVDSAGADLSALLATVDQLASDAPTQLIDLDLVRATLVSSGTENQFEMADLVWRRQTSQALVAFRQLAERNGASAACVTGVAALSYSLRTLARYVAERPSGSQWQVASALGVPAWKVDVLAAQARLWKSAELAAAAVVLADADAESKGGLGEAGALDPEQKLYRVERLIRQLAGN